MANYRYLMDKKQLFRDVGHGRYEDVINTLENALENHVNVNIKTDDGATLLFIAVQQGRQDLVELFLNRELQPVFGENVDKPRNDGITPLYMAAYKGYTGIVELLLNSGANVNYQIQTNGARPLFIAAEEGHEEIVELLLSRGAKHAEEALRYVQPTWFESSSIKSMLSEAVNEETKSVPSNNAWMNTNRSNRKRKVNGGKRCRQTKRRRGKSI